MDEFREYVTKEADRVLKEEVPLKIRRLDELHTSMKMGEFKNAFVLDQFPYPETTPLEVCRVPVNAGVRKMLDILKQDICSMIGDLDSLRLWLKLSMPRVEDGNNFGVAVQEEILSMLNAGRTSAMVVLQLVSRYYQKRGKLITRMRKRPHVQDFTVAVRDIDEKQFINLVQASHDLRNNYALVYDRVMKNKDKLEKPKGDSEAHLDLY